jgi:hypothetical protein
MPNPAYELVQNLVREEMERVVTDAFVEGRILHAGRSAWRLLQAYPNCGLSPETLVNEIGARAARSGVAVELARPGEFFSGFGEERTVA